MGFDDNYGKGLFGRIFDNDYRQRTDINAASMAADIAEFSSDVNAETITKLHQQLHDSQQQISELQQRLGQTELIVEALVRVHDASGNIDIEALKAVAKSLDLADGVVDGKSPTRNEILG